MSSYSRLKFDTPSNTVSKIKELLKDSPVSFKETFFSNSVVCNSVAITDDTTGISTYGKGVSQELALASGYGEFIEYLQGLILANPHKYFPSRNIFSDDVELTAQEIWEQGKDMFVNAKISLSKIMMVLNPSSDTQKFICHKYTDLISNKVYYIPVDFYWLVGNSSGMASGNNLKEALQHALSESVERKTMEMVLFEGFVGNLISSDCYEQYDDIKVITDALKAQNIDYYLFDCSFGGKVFSTMLILMDEFGRYKANFAASSSFPVAVERCFTEIFQGYDINNAKSLLWESGKTSLDNPVNLRDAVSLGNYTITQRHYDACFSEPTQVAAKNASTVQDFIDHLTSAPDLPIKNILYREISFLGFTTVQLITLPVPIFYMPMNIYPSLRSRNELLEGKYSITAENIGPIFTNFTRCHTFNDKLRHNINDVLVIAILAALNGSDYIQTAYNCYKDFCRRTETYDNLFTRLFVIKSFGCQPAELSELLTLMNDLIKGENVFSDKEKTLASWVLSKSVKYSQPSCENIQSLILLPEQEV